MRAVFLVGNVAIDGERNTGWNIERAIIATGGVIVAPIPIAGYIITCAFTKAVKKTKEKSRVEIFFTIRILIRDIGIQTSTNFICCWFRINNRNSDMGNFSRKR